MLFRSFNYEPGSGESISDTVRAMLALIEEGYAEVTATFNGTALRADRETTADQLVTAYFNEREGLLVNVVKRKKSPLAKR